MKNIFWYLTLAFFGLFIFEAFCVPLKLSSNENEQSTFYTKIRQKRAPKEQEDIDLQQKLKGYEKLEDLKSKVVEELRLKRDEQMKDLKDKKSALFNNLKAILEQESRLKRNPIKELITQLFKTPTVSTSKNDEKIVEDPRLKRDEININPLQANEDILSPLPPPVKRNLLDSISTLLGVDPMLGLGRSSGGVANFISTSIARVLRAVLDVLTNLLPGFNTIIKPTINMIGTGMSRLLKLYGGEGSSILDSIGEILGVKIGGKKGSSLLTKGSQELSEIIDEIVKSQDDIKDLKEHFPYIYKALGLGRDNQIEKVIGKTKSVKVYPGKSKASESNYFNNFNDDSHFNLVYEND